MHLKSQKSRHLTNAVETFSAGRWHDALLCFWLGNHLRICICRRIRRPLTLRIFSSWRASSRRPAAPSLYYLPLRVPYRLGWLTNAPWVGQSFGTERLGMTLTSRLRPPPDRPSHNARASVSFFPPWLSRSKFRLHISEYGNKEPKGRQRTGRLLSAVAILLISLLLAT